MNEQDLEKLLRGVVDGPQPDAPDSLHRFLRDLPETELRHHHGPLGRLRAYIERIRASVAVPMLPRPALAAFGVALAVIVGVAGAGVLVTMRSNSNQPAASASFSSPKPWETPRRSTPSKKPPVVASPSIAPNPSFPTIDYNGLSWTGLTNIDNENMATPKSAVELSTGEFLGVANVTDGLVTSQDGLYWDWTPPSAIDPKAMIVSSIASDGSGTIVVGGGSQGVDGTTDGRIWVSKDNGKSWQQTNDESVFGAVSVQNVVYGSGKFLALGWNKTTAADESRQVGAWLSSDGFSWTHVSVPIMGTGAIAVSTAAGFVLSGTPLDTGAINEPPMWHSADGQNWTRSTASDNTAQKMGPLVSVSVTSASWIYAVSMEPDGVSTSLVKSADGGITWHSLKPDDSMPYANMYVSVATLGSSNATYASDLIFVTVMSGEGGGHIFMSANDGLSWVRVYDINIGGPYGKWLLEIPSGYQAGPNAKRFLAYGDPSSGLGIWMCAMANG